MSRTPTVMKNFSKDSAFVTYESSSGTLDFTLSANFATYSNFEYELLGVELHIVGTAPTTTENFTVIRDATAGSPYDAKLYSKDMGGVKDIVWGPEEPLLFALNDEVDIAWLNSEAKTYGLSVRYRRLT